jgi:hypothetical protein
MQTIKRSPIIIRKKLKLAFYLVSLLLLISAGCDGADDLPAASSGRGFADIWYVSLAGDDSNSCESPSESCATMQAVLGKIDSKSDGYRARYDDIIEIGHTIHVAAGTYLRPHLPGSKLEVTENVTILGAGASATILDFDGNGFGFHLGHGYNFVIKDLTVQNISHSGVLPAPPEMGVCIYALQADSIRLENVNLLNCGQYGASFTDHTENQRISLIGVRFEGNQYDGLLQSRGFLTVHRGTFRANERAGIWLYNVELSISESEFLENGLYGIQLWGSIGKISDSDFLRNGSHDSVEVLGITYSVASAGVHSNRSDRPPNITVQDSYFAENNDGIYSSGRDAELTVSDTTFLDNHRTGVQIHSGTANLVNVSIRGNGSVEADPGRYIGGITQLGGVINLEESIVTGNYGGIKIFKFAEMDILNSTVSENIGLIHGGITNSGTLNISGSTINGNSSEVEVDGIVVGGIANNGEAHIENSTISRNLAPGIYSTGPLSFLELLYVTVASNDGIGLVVDDVDSSGLFIGNSLFSANKEQDCRFAFDGLPADANNIDSDGSCRVVNTYSRSEIALGPLQDNGGLTHTQALGVDSPAINAASGPCPEVDQRGISRPQTVVCDMGAYEAESGFQEEAEAGEEGEAGESESEAIATALTNSSCRKGADPAHELHNFLFEGQSALVVGRLSEATWVYVELPDDLGRCWIFSENLDLTGPVDSLPLFTSPALPQADEGGGDDGSGDEGGGNDGGGNDGGGNDGGGNDGGGGGSAPAAPSNVNHSCSGGGSEFTVFWNDNSDNEDGFRILRDGAEVGSVGPNVTQFVYDPLGSGPYTITVEAFNGDGIGKDSQSNVGCFG